MEKNKFYWKLLGTPINILVSLSCVGYEIICMSLEESLGGQLSLGWIEIRKVNEFFKDSLLIIYKQKAVYISLLDESFHTQLDIYGWITNIEVGKDEDLHIDFVVFPYNGHENLVNREFFTCPVINSYKTNNDPRLLNTIILKLWGGDLVFKFECESDLNTSLPEVIYLRNETNLLLLTKLLYSYRKNSVFGYGLNGGFIKDIELKTNLPELKTIPLVGDVNISLITGISRNNEYILHLNLRYPMENLSNNISGLLDNINYRLFGKDWESMMSNYYYNKLIMSSCFHSSFEAVATLYLPLYTLGDIVAFRDKVIFDKVPEEYFFNSSNIIFISGPNSDKTDLWGNKFSVSSIFRGLQDNYSNAYPTPKYPGLEGINLLNSGIV